jgi:kelch-like protein 10
LDPQFVLENIKDHPYVAGNDECCVTIMVALKYLLRLEMLTEKEWKITNPEFSRPRINQHETLFILTQCILTRRNNCILKNDTRTNRLVKAEEIPDVNSYGTAVIGFNIYVIGGIITGMSSKSCRRFNVVAKKWREVSPMHEKRFWLSVAVLDELVYAMGGFDCNTAERYDHRTNQWSMIAPMNKKRCSAGAATLNGKIYVAGGRDNSIWRSAEVYDPEVNQWTSIANMIFPRSCFSCIAYHGYIYAIGGSNKLSSIRYVEKYNPTTNKWMQIRDMSRSRKQFGTVLLNDEIFVIGGIPDGRLFGYAVECYNERSNGWAAISNMCESRLFAYLSACVIMGLSERMEFD